MKIFHHNDNDGRAAAAMIYRRSYQNTISLTMEDFIEVNYVDSVPSASMIEKDEEVYIVDYSFTSKTKDILLDLYKKSNNITWIDHHVSSLEILEEIKNTTTIKSIIDIDRSGAKIAYDMNIEECGSIYNKFISQIIDLVDDHDRWIHNLEDSIYFNIGSTMYDTHPMSKIWITDPKDIISIGKTLKEFKDNHNRRICNIYSYECTINGHKCIVLNTPEPSSQAFVEYYNKYNFAIRYAFDGKVYRYSIYSNLKDIDCSKIAKFMDPKGGGHKGAAGFVSDKIEFLPNTSYTLLRRKLYKN